MPLSPAIVIEDAARVGELFAMSFDPAHVPDRVGQPDPHLSEGDPRASEDRSFSGDYFRVAQMLHADDFIARYAGPVLLVHGDEDEAVPLRYSEHVAAKYASAKLAVIAGDDHCYHRHLDQATAAVQDFLRAQHA